jgi:methylase of polypeptide subunit release factors
VAITGPRWPAGQDGTVTEALLDTAGIDRLRTALTTAGYTSTGIAERIGPAATAALGRNDLRAALSATAGAGDPLATLIRLFVCGQTEPPAAVAAAFAPLDTADAVAAGIVEAAPGGYRAGLEIEAYGDQWIVSDLDAAMRPGRPLPADHVLGVGGASTTLAQSTIRRPVGTALDLGTGCGVQALHLSTHADRVTATDLSGRALRFAATTAALSGLDWELLRGDLVDPVAGRRFDLVVSNPPFVVGPGTTTHTYRDSGRPGDAVCAELVAAAPGLLAEGGYLQFLANWLQVAGEDWADRVAGWIAGTGLDAWVIQREVSDPVGYVNLWLADAAEDPTSQPARAAAWLDWFDANKIEAIGLGLITLRAGGHDDPAVRVEDLRQPVDRLGAQVEPWFDRQDWLRRQSGESILGARLRAVDGLRLHQEATRGPDGWQVDRQLLALTEGLHWVEQIDPVVLALVSSCDGELALRDQLDLLSAAHQVDAETLADAAVPLVAHLVERGFLLPRGD